MSDPIKIFVFGSNVQGIHGAGAALEALKHHGAIRGRGVGLQGRSYAIPTKLTPRQSLDLVTIRVNVNTFLEFARNNKQYEFKVTPIGCGLAGYKATDIAPMFKDSPANVILPYEFIQVLQTTSQSKVIDVLLKGFDAKLEGDE